MQGHEQAESCTSRLQGPRSLLGAVQDEFQQVLSIPLPQMAFNAEGHTYVVLARPQGVLAAGKLLNTLKFTVKEIDPSTGAPACAAKNRSDPGSAAPASADVHPQLLVVPPHAPPLASGKAALVLTRLKLPWPVPDCETAAAAAAAALQADAGLL